MTSAGGDGKNVLTSTGNVGSLRILKESSACNGSSAHLYDFHYFSMSRGSSKLFANIKFQWRIKIASALHTSNPNISELNFLTWSLSSSLVCKSLRSIVARPHHRLKEFNYTDRCFMRNKEVETRFEKQFQLSFACIVLSCLATSNYDCRHLYFSPDSNIATVNESWLCDSSCWLLFKVKTWWTIFTFKVLWKRL